MKKINAILALLLIVASASCSDVQIEPFVPLDLQIVPNNKFTVKGTACSDPANDQTAPTNFVFIIDESFSNEDPPGSNTDPLTTIPNIYGIDPVNQRTLAVLDLMQNFYDPQEGFDPNKRGIIVKFNGHITVCGLDTASGLQGTVSSGTGSALSSLGGIGFAPFGLLQTCLTPVLMGTEWTESGNAALALQDIMENEVGSVSALESLLKTWVVFFVSDGVPDDANGQPGPPYSSFYEDPVNVVQVWDDIYDTFRDKVRDLQFFDIQYGYNVLSPAEQATADFLGNGITANNTRGQYISITSLATISLIDLLAQEFSLKKNIPNFFVNNDSGRIRMSNGIPEFQADSDADGLTDKEEALIYGTIFDEPDSDGDGFSDFDEIKLGLNPNNNSGTNCTSANGAKDSDHDGLTDCAELLYGTSESFTDTDGDGMPDRLELLYGLNPLVNDADGDPDNDNITNIVEVQQGTLPDIANDEVMNSMAMSYALHSYELGTRICIDFTVSNVSTAVTAANASGQIGVNYLKLMSKISVFNDSLSVVWREADKSVIYTGEDKIPATSVVTVDDSEFQ